MYYNYILPLHATSVHNQTLHGALSMARSMLAPPTWLVSSHFCGHPLPCSKESNADSKRASSSLVRLDGPFVRPPLLRIFWPMWRSNSNLSMLSFVKIRPFWFMALAPLPITIAASPKSCVTTISSRVSSLISAKSTLSACLSTVMTVL